jgi:diguanylate cyclase (GGDEF)-like protein
VTSVPKREKLNVLLVMPDTTMARTVETVLRDGGFSPGTITRATGLHDSVEALRKSPVSVCLVHDTLEDGVSVFDFIDRAVKVEPTPPIIVMSAREDIHLDEECQRGGAAFFIDLRTLSGNELERAIRYSVGHARQTSDLKYSAVHDRLTGLLNRTSFMQRLEEALFRSARSESSVCVACIDLQKVEQINEEHGHDLGDKVLQAVSHRLRSSIRRTDVVARFGSDEFGCLIENFGDDGNAVEVIKKLVLGFKVPVRVEGQSFNVIAAAGIALHPKHGDTPDMVVHVADSALTEARSQAAKTGTSAYVFGDQD